MSTAQTAVTKKEQAQLAKYGGLMDDTDVSASDILIPKLLLMQAMSVFVTEEKARIGEIRGSVDRNLVAAKDKNVEIIAFAVYKTWTTFKKKGNEYVGQIPLTMANAMKPREEFLDGEEVQNFETLNYYCLLPEEVAKGVYMPYVVSFRSTGYLAGKTLETHRARLKEFGKPLPFKTFLLGSEQRENDKGKFFVFTIQEGRDSTDEELEAVKKWNAIVKQGAARVDDSDLQETRSTEKNVTPGKVQTGDEY